MVGSYSTLLPTVHPNVASTDSARQSPQWTPRRTASKVFLSLALLCVAAFVLSPKPSISIWTLNFNSADLALTILSGNATITSESALVSSADAHSTAPCSNIDAGDTASASPVPTGAPASAHTEEAEESGAQAHNDEAAAAVESRAGAEAEMDGSYEEGLHDTGVDMTVAEKLYGFPSVYVVTMNSPARASPVIHRLQVTELHAVMTEGVNGSDTELLDRLAVYNQSHFYAPGEIGCTLGHLEAIRKFYDHSNDEYGVIVEDDFGIQSVKHWRETWEVYFSRIPQPFSIVQLSVTTMRNPTLQREPSPRVYEDWGTVMYMISRQGAKEIMDKYLLRDGRWNLLEPSVIPDGENSIPNHRPVADIVIYSIPGPVLRYPLFNVPISRHSETQAGGRNSFQWDAGRHQLKEWKTAPV